VSIPGAEAFPVVVIAASAGGINALGVILASLPADFRAGIAIVQHRSPQAGLLAEALSYLGGRTVRDANEGDRLTPGSVFVAPAGKHLLINRDGSLSLSDSAKVHSVRPAADRLFASGAESLRGRLIAVVLTGGDGDGSDGVRTVKAMGGRVIAQDETTSEVFSMPASAIATGCVDFVVPLGEIGPALVELVSEDV
jgi:two-component system chemotaxis response regulator CheB